jgi:nickel transport system substrate-binding protein
MIKLTRRSALLSAVALGGSTLLPNITLADGHKTLKIAIGSEAGDLDLLQNVSALSTYSLVFDALIHYGSNGVLQPALAESWSESDDGLELSFALREGVKFSDGTDFDAEVAKWNLERWMGKDDFSWIGVSDAMEAIETNGSHGLTIRLKRAVPVALLELTIVRPVRFLSPNAADAEGNQTSPIGTGPWMITENDNSGTKLVRNPHYWGSASPLEAIELKVVPDELSRSNGLRSGDLHVIGGDWVSPLSPRRARAMQNSGDASVVAEQGTTGVSLTFSPKSPMLQDQGVREAIKLCINRTAIVTILYEGFADPINNVFPGVIPESGTRNDIPARDVDAAKALISGAGWAEANGGWEKDGSKLLLELMVSEEALPGARRMAEMVQGMISESGIEVTVSSVDNATIHDRRPTFDYDLTFMVTFGAPYDPHGTLANLFLSNVDSGPDGKFYMHEDLDPIVNTALETPGAARDAEMQKIYTWLQDNAAVCPLVAPQRLWAHSSQVKGFALPATDYDIPSAGIDLG